MNNTIAKTTSSTHRDDVPLLDISINNVNNHSNTTISLSNETDQLSDKATYLRAKLRFFYMSPCWKWHLKRQFPWKAWFQFIKIIIVTAQLILFGIDRQTHVIFISECNITFHHLFVRDWTLSEETLPYPRAEGDFAVFTNYDLIDSINYSIRRFNNLTNMSVGVFDYHDDSIDSKGQHVDDRLFTICLNRFKTCRTNPSSHEYILDPQIENICYKFNATDDFNIEQSLIKAYNETINYCSLNLLTIEFIINAIQVKNQDLFSFPDCYHFDVKLYFDNNARTGKIRQRLNSEAHFHSCQTGIIHENSTSTNIRRNLLISFDSIIIIICFISFILCIRSLWKGHKLAREIRMFFASKRSEEKPLTWIELQTFYSFWYFLMILTDLLVICGTIIKIIILFQIRNDYNTAGLLLGVSSLLSWFGILRYLSFFRKYNLLFVTIQRAFPLLLRFLLCALILFCGFVFCGWSVFGPYHTKFRTLVTTFDTLFGLINGDDMYATFANLETESTYIWLFSEIYLYSFSCLFIYLIAGLVIGLIIDGYDTKYYTEGFPKNRLQKFSEEDASHWSGVEEWQDLTTAIGSKSVCFPCCFRTPVELTDMIARDTYLLRNANVFQ